MQDKDPTKPTEDVSLEDFLNQISDDTLEQINARVQKSVQDNADVDANHYAKLILENRTRTAYLFWGLVVGFGSLLVGIIMLIALFCILITKPHISVLYPDASIKIIAIPVIAFTVGLSLLISVTRLISPKEDKSPGFSIETPITIPVKTLLKMVKTSVTKE